MGKCRPLVEHCKPVGKNECKWMPLLKMESVAGSDVLSKTVEDYTNDILSGGDYNWVYSFMHRAMDTFERYTFNSVCSFQMQNDGLVSWCYHQQLYNDMAFLHKCQHHLSKVHIYVMKMNLSSSHLYTHHLQNNML